MESSLKLATTPDIPLLLRFIEAYHELEHLPFNRESVKRTLEPFLNTDYTGRIWLITLDDKAIGYVILGYGYSIEFHGRDAFIDEFFIVEPYRGHGIGKKILTYIKAEAATLGVRALHLEVGRDNQHAQSLYESTGFKLRERYVTMSMTLEST